MNSKKSELLLPAGNLDKLKMAILYGADAVYIGTPDMSLRTKSAFSLEDLIEGIEYAHQFNKKVYLTLNLFSHNKDIPKLENYIDTVKQVNPDGLIIADPGIFQYVKERAPEIELHISTQANICSWLSVKFWEEQGASLCVMAREVSFAELAEIREKCPDIKLETFIHGAMCMTYSGRCLLSNFMAERGANQGNCANSCRWNYQLNIRLKDGTVEELDLNEDNIDLFQFMLREGFRPGDYFPIEEDSRGSYILNSKDLCMMPHLDEYLKIGVDSLKVEGRNKSIYYVAMVARTYRNAIDDYYNNPQLWNAKPYMQELDKIPNRGYTHAFHEGRLTHHAHNYEDTKTFAAYQFAGMIHSITEDAFNIEVKNYLQAGDVLEFVSPVTDRITLLRIYQFENIKNGKITEDIHAGPQPIIKIPFSLFANENIEELINELPVMSVIRKEAPLTEEKWNRIKSDNAAQKIECGNGDEKIYREKIEILKESLTEENLERRLRTPRLGTEGCCAKGCNGCLIFWHEPQYEKARELLASKKSGEMLDNSETQNLKKILVAC